MPRRRDRNLLQAIGQRVAKARKDRGWTQEALAEAVGIEPVSLSRLETGDRALSLSTLAHIANAVGVGLGDLLDTGRGLPPPSHAPDEAEILRAFQGMSRPRRQLLLRLARELSSKG
jgi:transcriptional regulator with XRE-family HTH domain